jgi:hypothetical protein
MNRILTIAGTTLIAATLTACAPGINATGNHITFDGSGMLISANGQPAAHISSDGELRIGARAIAVTPAQRTLLQHYYGEAQDVMRDGETVGKAGAQLGAHAVGNAIAGIFSGKSDQAEKTLDAQSKRVEQAAGMLCGHVKQLDAIQQEIAASIPAFAPYADADKAVHCKTTTTVNVSSLDSSPNSADTAIASSSASGATVAIKPASGRS